MDRGRNCGSRKSVTWGKNGGRRTRLLLATITLFAGLALGSAPIAGACPKPPASWLS